MKQRCCPRCALIFMLRKSASARQRGARLLETVKNTAFLVVLSLFFSFLLFFFVFLFEITRPTASAAAFTKRGMNN